MKCSECRYMELSGYCLSNGNNNSNPRGHCYCTHPKAEETFARVCPKSPRMPGFIGYTAMGGTLPQIKTAPRWCPLREELAKQ